MNLLIKGHHHLRKCLSFLIKLEFESEDCNINSSSTSEAGNTRQFLFPMTPLQEVHGESISIGKWGRVSSELLPMDFDTIYRCVSPGLFNSWDRLFVGVLQQVRLIQSHC